MKAIADSAYKYMNHDMIRQYTPLPEFPEVRTQLLRAFLAPSSRMDEKNTLNDAVSLAVSLAQLGLDTHELVEASEHTSRKQMAVLAGDYFSSRFYQLLSQAENVQSIMLLSRSICEVNRMKMGLYTKAKKLLLSAEEYVRASVEVKSHLFLSFTSWMEELRRKSWPHLIRTVVECELFMNEMKRTRPDNVKNSWSYWHILQYGSQSEIELLLSENIAADELAAVLHKHNVAGKLADHLETKLHELKTMLQGLGSERFMHELLKIADPLFRFTNNTMTAKVLEEI
jgi:heptaprenyl diphosphate synthase